jgi:hypothetical protein
VRNLRTSFPLCVQRVTYISIMRICTQVVAAGCMKGWLYLSALFFCPLVIFRLSFISLNLQWLFKLFSRVLNATRRRLGWRRRVFVCYVYRCGLTLLTPLPITHCLLPFTRALHKPFKPPRPHHVFNRARWLDCNYVSYMLNERLRWSGGSVMAFGTRVRGFKPGRSRRIFRAKKSSARLPSEVK